MTKSAETNIELTKMFHTRLPFTAELGLEVVSAAPEKVVILAHWAAQRCTVGGALHGGYLMAVADSAGGGCAGLNLPPGSSTSTIESKTNFFRGVKEGVITAVASPIHVGRMTIVVQTDITDEAGNLVTRTIQTQAVLLPKRQDG